MKSVNIDYYYQGVDSNENESVNESEIVIVIMIDIWTVFSNGARIYYFF